MFTNALCFIEKKSCSESLILYIFRLILNIAFMLLAYVTPKLIKKDGVINIPVYYNVILAVLILLQQVSYFYYCNYS